MLSYIIRRTLYAIPILLGVNVLVFLVFFFVNTPDDMAKLHLGAKRVTPEQVDRWKREHSLDLPRFFNNGWTQVGSLQAEKKINQKIFGLKEGKYEIVLQTPESVKLAAKRKINLNFKNVKRVESDLKDLSSINFPAEIGERVFSFEVLGPDQKNDLPVPTKEVPIPTKEVKISPTPMALEISFQSEKAIPTHRLLLKYKAPISFFDRFTRTIFFTRSLKMIFFQYGRSENGRDIGNEVLKRMMPSLVVSLPTFFVGLALNIFFAMMLALFRGTYIDYWGVFLAVVGMSISVMFYIIFGQVVMGKYLRLFPISGFGFGFESIKFVIMPVMIAILSGLGGSVRFYRTIFLEEINREYVTTARAKGLSEGSTLFIHVLKNAMIPILTGVVVYLPFLFIGSLLLESFFAIPGLGAFLLEAIQRKDFAIVQAMVSLGSFLYVLGLVLTDISYTFVDPRVRLGS